MFIFLCAHPLNTIFTNTGPSTWQYRTNHALGNDYITMNISDPVVQHFCSGPSVCPVKMRVQGSSPLNTFSIVMQTPGKFNSAP